MQHAFLFPCQKNTQRPLNQEVEDLLNVRTDLKLNLKYPDRSFYVVKLLFSAQCCFLQTMATCSLKAGQGNTLKTNSVRKACAFIVKNYFVICCLTSQPTISICIENILNTSFSEKNVPLHAFGLFVPGH